MEAPSDSVLPRWVKFSVPVLSFAVIFVFMFIFLFWPRRVGEPIQGAPINLTIFFVPVYVTIAVVLIVGSLYLFKWIMDYDPSEPTNYRKHRADAE